MPISQLPLPDQNMNCTPPPPVANAARKPAPRSCLPSSTTAPPLAAGLPLTAGLLAILARAREILQQAPLSDGERQVRLQVVKATLTGTVIRPSEDSPEMRNPAFWTLVDDRFVPAEGVAAVDAIADLWVVHHGDGVPVPRIRCLKYTSLILIQGFIQHFQETGHAAGLTAINELIGHGVIPQDLPNRGDNILWHRHLSGDHLLPGDQVWFDNPFFDRGRALFQQRFYQEALRSGLTPADALATARQKAEDITAGEEGSNVFYLGDDKFILGADSLIRPCRKTRRPPDSVSATPHELVLAAKIFDLDRFREHMIDDNFSVQACLRANPAMVLPESFTIERVRAPIDPEYLLRHHAIHTPGRSLDALVDAIASHNPPPVLVRSASGTLPRFDANYDWAEQRRVGLAFDAVMRAAADETWWQLRDRIDDDRYVLTASRGEETMNFTIGMLCADLIDLRLCLGFTSHLPLVPGKLPRGFHPEHEFWRNEAHWARERRPLYLMQATLCEAALEQWPAVKQTEPGSDGRAHIFTADEKARYTAALKQEIDERQRTRRAACEEVILPWLPTPAGWEGFDPRRAQEVLAACAAG